MEALGINWKILLAQIVNFIILFWLLKRFALKPFLSVLKKRQTDIEEGIKKSEKAERSLQEIRNLAKEIKEKGAKEASKKWYQLIKNEGMNFLIKSFIYRVWIY